MSTQRNSGVTKTVLKAFIPYSQENLMLSYKPGKLFNYLDSLENHTGASRKTLRTTIDRAQKARLIKIDSKTGMPITTWLGKTKVGFKPRRQNKRILVIAFDIPESRRRERNLLRAYLVSSYAEPVQKSVWKTKYDITEELNEVIDDLSIRQFVAQFMTEEVD